MLTIHCEDVAKKYRKEVLYKHFTYTFEQPKTYAILGPNASGKSTLLKIISGVLAPTKGNVIFNQEPSYEQISFSSPELDLLEDYTVQELFDFHFQLKEPKIPVSEQINLANLHSYLPKKYSELSSGLRNKVKLTLSMFTKADALLLDEPCTNFDVSNTEWYREMIRTHTENQLVIVASNQPQEYDFCEEKIHLHHFK